jgi:predicted metal-binding transcription factor (methanogenesis marker protein 9)
MLKHSNPEVQLLVEMLEGQRDSVMAQAAALFRENTELKQALQEKLVQESKEKANAVDSINDPQGAEGQH